MGLLHFDFELAHTYMRDKLRWAIIGTGNIARQFVSEFQVTSNKYKHVVVSIGSRTEASADSFRAFCLERGATDDDANPPTTGTYKEAIAQDGVDIVYIATPHTHHYVDAMLAIRYGKNVLVEKPMTESLKATAEVMRAAKVKGLFCMEAVWTRFLPIRQHLQINILGDGQRRIGKVYRVWSDCSSDATDYGVEHRVHDAVLAGGSVLDLGPYALTWAMDAIGAANMHTIEIKHAFSTSDDRTRGGVDIHAFAALYFRDPIPVSPLPITTSHAYITTSIRGISRTEENIRIEGSQGLLRIYGPTWSPDGYIFTDKATGLEEKYFINGLPGLRGFRFQMDACGDQIKAHATEHPECSHEYSLKVRFTAIYSCHFLLMNKKGCRNH